MGYMDDEKDSEGRTASPSPSEVLRRQLKLHQKQILSAQPGLDKTPAQGDLTPKPQGTPRSGVGSQ